MPHYELIASNGAMTVALNSQCDSSFTALMNTQLNCAQDWRSVTTRVIVTYCCWTDVTRDSTTYQFQVLAIDKWPVEAIGQRIHETGSRTWSCRVSSYTWPIYSHACPCNAQTYKKNAIIVWIWQEDKQACISRNWITAVLLVRKIFAKIEKGLVSKSA